VYRERARLDGFPANSILSIDRNRLVTVLLKQLTQQHLRIRSRSTLAVPVSKDGTAKTVIETGGGDPFTVSYDLLVGADGARSVIRV